jgi:DMSO/TMAO reductase YedYZ molybdopterin-dependent catalytic subunit
MMITRRTILGTVRAAAGIIGAGALLPRRIGAAANEAALKLSPALPEGTRSAAVLESLPGKRPLIKLSYRPPNYETPIEYFRTAITPNDAFFVRYHLPDIHEVDPRTWKLVLGGEGASGQVEINFADLKAMPAVEVVAVNQCSGNRRGLFQPHVPGVQWGPGAMGCARWKGVRLKDVLEKAGVKKEAIEVVFDGADGPLLDKTPDFVKSIPLWKAMEDTTLIAYEMNGEPLPHLNGFPARIVVPGWTATYWVKHITSINIAVKPYSGFWMNTAYRIPLGKFPLASRFASQENSTNTPITEILVNSLITSHLDGANVKGGGSIGIGGVAWDGGYGVRSVEISTDEGRSWLPATLGEDLGRFAFRTFSFPVSGNSKGKRVVMARATNRIGQTQTTEPIQNPAGYHHNVMHSIAFNVT